ncbi:MAG: carboxypeptidase regulatory-like domain-containing protein, partial [Acidobacteriota bacterium]
MGLAVTGGAWGAVPEDSRSVSRGVSLERLRGKPLVDVLALLRQAGLNIVYSSGLVSPSLIVEREPTSSEPREILDELLPSFGLIALEGPAGAILIVRAGEIRGAVLSQETGLPIAGALVRVEHGPGAALSAVSGSDGSFRIGGIAPGSYDVWAQAQGFSEQDARDVRVSSGQPTSLTFRMSRPTYASELTVMPSKLSVLQDEPAARIIVSDDDVVNVPAFGGDVSRVVELLPGVAAGDNTAAFNVRGSESRDVMLLLDGLELYEPFHLRTLQSPFSLIDAKLVERLDLLSGGFTAEYGDRQGAVVDLTTPYLTSHRRMAVELGSINSRFLHHRPFAAGRGTWLVSARTWYPEKFRDTIQLGEDDLEPRFSDLYGKVSTAFGDR